MIGLDERLFQWINGFAGRWRVLDAVARLFVNDYFALLLISFLLLAMWFWGRDDRTRAALQLAAFQSALAITIAGLAVKLAYVWLHRPRPFDYLPVHLLFYEPTDPSFPAKPAAVAFAAAVGIWLGHRKLGLVALVLASLFSAARVFAGVHFPGDVIGGAVLGAACAALSYYVVRWAAPWLLAFIKVVRKFGLA